MARAFNGPQLDAARACAACVEGRGGRRLALVQGPPGTGKTHCVLGILAAAFGAAPPTGATIAPPRLGGTTLPSATPAARNSRRILLCAPSHCAVDELVRRVATSGILSSSGGTFRPSLLRLGAHHPHPPPHAAARLLPKLRRKRRRRLQSDVFEERRSERFVRRVHQRQRRRRRRQQLALWISRR